MSALVTGGAGVAIPYFLIGPSVDKENSSQKKYDADQVPFTASVQPERAEPPFWIMVLDRELTAAETRTMTATNDNATAFSYLRNLGAHLLEFPPYLADAPAGFPQATEREVADVVKMNVLSTRAYPVVIDDLTVTDVRCAPSTMKTIVALPPQGGGAYEGIRLHVPPRPDEPVLTDSTEGQGKPYFANRYIEVGGGQSAGALRVEAIAPEGQSCEWSVTVHYGDVHQNGRDVPLADREGKPIRIRTESLPDAPRQKWVFGSVPWTPCHDVPQDPACDLV